jgi:hypothetical protein
VSSEVGEAQLQARDATASMARTIRHIVKRVGVVLSRRPATIAETLV